MKKTTIYLTLSVIVLLCFTGCGGGKNHGTESRRQVDKTSAVDLHISDDKVIDTINSCSNLQASKELSVKLPSKKTSVYQYTADYNFDVDMKDYDSEFREMFRYLFPDHSMNENHLLYSGGSSKLEYDDETGELVQDYNKVKDWKDQILSGKEGRVYYIYDDTWNENMTEWKPSVCLELGNPIGYGYGTVNKGKTVALNGSKVENDDTHEKVYPGLDGYDPSAYLEYVASYSPDSTEKYQLEDRKIAVCDAVKFLEKYINSLPGAGDKTAKTVVTEVDVYRVTINIYGYNMITTKEYEGIPFDYMRAGEYEGRLGYDKYSSLIGNAFMVESKDVDIIDGFYLKENAVNRTNLSEIISLESAIKSVSSQMTEHIKFKVNEIELVYAQQFARTKNGYIDTEHSSAKITPAWKITLENTNDEMTYVCYLDAADGQNYRYAMIPTKWWKGNGK